MTCVQSSSHKGMWNEKQSLNWSDGIGTETHVKLDSHGMRKLNIREVMVLVRVGVCHSIS